jgi:hypothetical protein
MERWIGLSTPDVKTILQDSDCAFLTSEEVLCFVVTAEFNTSHFQTVFSFLQRRHAKDCAWVHAVCALFLIEEMVGKRDR